MRVNSLITHLQLKNVGNLPVCACCIITFQLLEMCSITTPNETISNICTRYTFQRDFFAKNIGDFTDLKNEKNQIWKFCVNRIVSVIGTCVNVYQISLTWQPYLEVSISIASSSELRSLLAVADLDCGSI